LFLLKNYLHKKLVTLKNTLTYNVNLLYFLKMINAFILSKYFVYKNACILNLFYIQNLFHTMEVEVKKLSLNCRKNMGKKMIVVQKKMW